MDSRSTGALHRLFALAFALVAFASPALAQRLETTVVPEHYDLAFDVDLTKARFSGVEMIKVRLTQPSRRIVLHALDLQFQAVTILAGGTTQQAAVSLHEPTQTASLTVAQAVAVGPAEIRIRYTGILNNQLRGFYLSKVNNRRYAVTQFESTDARRAFPAFDEPALKATFSLRLTINATDTAISNGRLLTDTAGPGPGRHTLTFADTPKMSSYLVAMAVGDFECLEGGAESIPIRICTTPGKQDLGRIALDAATQILAFYNHYFSIPYPFKKLDVVAVPDFAAGAMENTAAIFYREVDLLADSKTASVTDQKRIWAVLAHEMAHQWFGDLVTMRWWDDLWLNEGFASWMEKRPLAAAKPEWRLDVEAVADTHGAMNLDALGSTRAIRSSVETPSEIEGSFDGIAYEKGASVLRMVEGYVGEDAFRRGVNAYLEQHAFGNATSADFWTAMTAASGVPVDRILPTFVNQPGVPVISAALTCTGGQSGLTLSTQRFFTDAAMGRTPRDSSSWQVPLCVRTEKGTAAICEVLAAPVTTLTLGATPCVRWAFINAGARGYFRTAYTPDMLKRLALDLATRLTEPERLSLLGDEWALVRAGRHTIGDYLTLVSGLGAERSHEIVTEVSSRLTFVRDYLTTDRTRATFEHFVQALFAPVFQELTLDGRPTDDDNLRALRGEVIDTLSGAGNDPQLSAAAQRALIRTLRGDGSIDPTAANAIVRAAAAHADAALWDRLLRASDNATSPSERYRYLYGLPSFQDPTLIDRGLQYALTRGLRSQDTPAFLRRFLANPSARAHTWAFVKQHWEELAPKITISLGDVAFVQGLGVFCDAPTRDDIRAFFTAHRLPAASRALDQTIERINNCVAIKATQSSALGDWLASR